MARFIQAEFSTEHAGVNRFVNGFNAIGRFDATRAVLHTLAAIGSPVTRGAASVAAVLAAASAERRQRREDEKLWNIALSDARVMADLSRAMSKDAHRDVRGYY